MYDRTTEFKDVPSVPYREPIAGLPDTNVEEVPVDWTEGINRFTYGGKPIKLEVGLNETDQGTVLELGDLLDVTEDDPTDPNHYKMMAITPTDYIVANNLSWHEGNIIKYVSRWQNKNGLEDLRKAKVYLEQLIKLVEDE